MLWFLPTLVVLAVLVPLAVLVSRRTRPLPAVVRVEQRLVREAWGQSSHN